MSELPERLVAAVAEFHNWVKLPRYQDLSPKVMYEFTDASVWEDPYLVDPNLPGCYVFEDVDGRACYVGSVSANSTFGYRFGNGYICKDPNDNRKVLRIGNAESISRIYVIDLPKEYAFVAPALEQFLITYLGSKMNSKDSVQALQKILIAEGKISGIS